MVMVMQKTLFDFIEEKEDYDDIKTSLLN